jgi:hypothetical protein
MDTTRTEDHVYYSIDASDQLISDTCERFHIAPDSDTFRDALAAVLNVDDATSEEGDSDVSIGHILEVAALLELTVTD